MGRGGDRGRVGYSRKDSGRVAKKKMNAGKETRAGAEICHSVFSSGASRVATRLSNRDRLAHLACHDVAVQYISSHRSDHAQSFYGIHFNIFATEC